MGCASGRTKGTEVDLGYERAEPPDTLFHETVARLLPAIRDKGLQRMERHHVHLSTDEATARAMGGLLPTV